jgi:hypothetical protein
MPSGTVLPRIEALLLVMACTLGLLVAMPPSAADARTDTVAETRFLDSINAERAQRGVSRLRADAELTAIARRHSVRMADRNHLHHNPNLATEVTSWSRVSENVGRGSSVPSLHTALMNSTGHRANILDSSVTQVGVGVEIRGSTVWVTQVFRNPRTVEAIRFSDVSRSSTHGRAIEALAASGVTMGCGNGRYCPERRVSRAEMGTFLARSGALVPRTPGTFSDTAGTAVHAANIEAIRADGVTTGCAPTRYCPTRDVTRAEMASFLVRARGLPVQGTTTRFGDVAAGSTHAGAIEALARAGITNGCGNGNYCPDRPVTRAEMASFLTRTFPL